ncbi:hypothetical protein AWV80_13765 [Cupriavidus sp. UYMU48A]|nr:hypothetical protein AWV80_13765 [Cupriavidus sp. UYMU48A]
MDAQRAGLWFDNWYGFGLADASAAVAMAKTYRSYLTGDMAKFVSRDCQPMTAACGRDIPVGTATGLGVQIPVSAPGVSRIEAVQVSLKLGHIRPGDLAVELISPAGTRSYS